MRVLTIARVDTIGGAVHIAARTWKDGAGLSKQRAAVTVAASHGAQLYGSTRQFPCYALIVHEASCTIAAGYVRDSIALLQSE